MQAADIDQAAVQPERLLGVHLERRGGESIDFEALPDAASQIAERLHILEDAERYAVFGQRGPEAAHVAEQGRALQIAAKDPERARLSLCG